MTPTKPRRPRADATATLLRPCTPQALQWDTQQIQLAITRRAYELFQSRGREHGHDWEDWFQAESELLRPVSVAVSEAADRFSLRANVFGFSESELKVSLEPRRITILGIRNMNAPARSETPQAADFYPDQILRSIDLSSEIDPEGAVVELQSGVLKFELPKVTKAESKAAVVGRA
jgi:HSP20 family molecular chaperone IbpA